MRTFRFLLPLLLSSACADPSGDALEDVRVGVVHDLHFARQADGESVGFDFDGLTSNEGDSTGCGIQDLTAPDGTPGIDNAFSNLVPLLDQTEARAVEDLILDAIQSGELLLVFEVSLPLSEDEESAEPIEPRVRIVRGGDAPILGNDDSVLPYQTISQNPDHLPIDLPEAHLEDDVVTGRGFDIPLALQILTAKLDFVLENSGLHLELDDDQGSMHGWFGGAIPSEQILAITDDEANAVDAGVVDLLEVLVDTWSDLDPEDTGECTHMSINFEFSTTPAYLYDDATLDLDAPSEDE